MEVIIENLTVRSIMGGGEEGTTGSRVRRSRGASGATWLTWLERK